MKHISLENIYMAYQKNLFVIKDLSLEIFDGELVVFIGDSGSGKSTILRIISGLEEINSGNLYINGEWQNEKDPSSRMLNIVFQNYALIPNLTVYENIYFGLLNEPFDKLEKKFKIEEIAKKLSIYNKLNRYPSQLSGGERQRVALARALVDKKEIILFDEPLSNLDALLRTQMRSYIIKLQKEFDLTAIYVTHDQIEAMSMASRIVLLQDGEILQVGTPHQMYNNPNNLDVAKFIGVPPINIIEGEVKQNTFFFGQNKFLLPKENYNQVESEQVYLAVRPNDIKVFESEKPNSFKGSIQIIENYGSTNLLHIKIEDNIIQALTEIDFSVNQDIYLSIKNNVMLFDQDKKRIRKQINNKIFIDLDDFTFEESKAIKELQNYGYIITDQNYNYHLKKNDNKYILLKDNKKVYFSLIKELFLHLNFVK